MKKLVIFALVTSSLFAFTSCERRDERVPRENESPQPPIQHPTPHSPETPRQ